MIAENFFNDILKSVVNLFENYIFNYKTFLSIGNQLDSPPDSYIKSYQFNIGNKTYQLADYRESNQLEFPTAIITLLNEDTAFGKTAALIGHNRITDVNEQLVLFCESTKKGVWLREDQTMLYIQAQINCESVLSAKEIEHQIKRFLPPTKFEQIAPFKTFFQLPDWFINKDFNPRNYVINNLFEAIEPTTGKPAYYYGISYKPIIKLDSLVSNIGDNSARSYSVVCDFSYLIPMPIWLYSDVEPSLTERITVNLAPGGYSDATFDDIATVGDEKHQFLIYGSDIVVTYEFNLVPRRIFILKHDSLFIKIDTAKQEELEITDTDLSNFVSISNDFDIYADSIPEKSLEELNKIFDSTTKIEQIKQFLRDHVQVRIDLKDDTFEDWYLLLEVQTKDNHVQAYNTNMTEYDSADNTVIFRPHFTREFPFTDDRFTMMRFMAKSAIPVEDPLEREARLSKIKPYTPRKYSRGS